MTDDKKNDRLIRAVMVLILICLLFICSVASGQILSPSDFGSVSGTTYYSDGVTPLPLNDTNNGSYIALFNTTTNSRITYFNTDNFGKYTSPQVPAGSYQILAMYNNNNVVNNSTFSIVAGQNVPLDLDTSRTSTNKTKLFKTSFHIFKINYSIGFSNYCSS
jgi:hypothetical protein